MSPFIFPDPNVTTVVTNDATGETWEYVRGVWQVRPPEDDHTHTESEITDLNDIQSKLDNLNLLVANLQADIIDLNSKVQTLEGTQFLILEQ